MNCQCGAPIPPNKALCEDCYKIAQGFKKAKTCPPTQSENARKCKVFDCEDYIFKEDLCKRHHSYICTQNQSVIVEEKATCIICNKELRGMLQRFGQICSKHYVPVEPRKCLFLGGCKTRPKSVNALFCSKHDEARQRARRLYFKNQKTKPFLKDIEALEAQLANES